MPCSIEEALGHVVRRRRKEKHSSHEHFAYEAGIDRTYVSDIERGQANPSLKILEKLAAGLGMTLSSLIAEVEQEREIASAEKAVDIQTRKKPQKKSRA
jgi:transcriptional regulator with XRE-family HTH domain